MRNWIKFDDTYSDSDDDDYSKNFNDSGAQDNVPPSDAQSGYLSQIEKRKKLLEEGYEKVRSDTL